MLSLIKVVILAASLSLHKDSFGEGYVNTNISQWYRDAAIDQLHNNFDKKPLTFIQDRLIEKRKQIPQNVKDHIELLNTVSGLLHDSNGEVDHEDFRDLQNSLMFLKSAMCRTVDAEQSGVCLMIDKQIHFPKDRISSARLITFMMPWINPNEIELMLHTTDGRHVAPAEGITYSENGTFVCTFEASKNQSYQPSCDMTSLFTNLQMNKENISYPIIFSLVCKGESCGKIEATHESAGVKDRIIKSDYHTTIELYTETGLRIKLQNENKRMFANIRENKRQKRNAIPCPNILDSRQNSVYCCLYQYELTYDDMLMDPELQFVIEPDTIPMGVCHGQCVSNETRLPNQPMSSRCSSSGTRPFSILTFGENGMHMVRIRELTITTGCSCS